VKGREPATIRRAERVTDHAAATGQAGASHPDIPIFLTFVAAAGSTGEAMLSCRAYFNHDHIVPPFKLQYAILLLDTSAQTAVNARQEKKAA